MGEINRDRIDKQMEEDDGFPISQRQEEQPPAGKLSDVYTLLGKGLPLGQIANELRVPNSQLRKLLKNEGFNNDIHR
jgi:hypothetical protein